MRILILAMLFLSNAAMAYCPVPSAPVLMPPRTGNINDLSRDQHARFQYQLEMQQYQTCVQQQQFKSSKFDMDYHQIDDDFDYYNYQ